MTKKENSMKVSAVGLDDGFAKVKLVSEKTEISIPSRAREGVVGISGFGGESFAGIYRVGDGETWTVDPDISDTVDTRTEFYPYSGLNRALVMYALEKAGFTGKDEILLVTGLPIRDYYSGNGRNEENIRAKESQFEKLIESADGRPLPKIVKHMVSPEGVSAWLAYAKENKLKGGENAPKWIGIIDIGGNTTDIAVVSPRNQIMDHKHSGSRDLGVLQVHDRLRQGILSRHGIGTISPALCDEVVRLYTKTGKATVRLSRKEIDITDIIVDAIGAVGAQIGHAINLVMGKGMMDEVEHMIVVGGGALMFSDHLGIAGAEIPSEPEYANARGMYIRASASLE